MKLLALDLGSTSGWSLGAPDAMPHVSSWRLKGQDHHSRAGNLAENLRDLCMLGGIELIAIEDAMSSVAMLSPDVVELTFLLHGAVDAVAACYGIPTRRTAVGTIRKHFVGKASAAAPRARGSAPRSAKQRAADREAIKALVWKRAVQLGYFERGERPQYDRSDSVAVFDHAAHTFCKVQRPFAMFAGV